MKDLFLDLFFYLPLGLIEDDLFIFFELYCLLGGVFNQILCDLPT